MSLIALFFKSYFKHIAFIVAVLAAFWWTYEKGYKDSEVKHELAYTKALAEKQQKFIEEVAALSNKYQTVSKEYQKLLETNRVTKEVIYETKLKEIEKPVYSQCLVPISGVQNLDSTNKRLNSSRSGKNTK